MSSAKSKIEYDSLVKQVEQKLLQKSQQEEKELEQFEIQNSQFDQLYWPIRDVSLQIIKMSESVLSRKLLFYSWKLNKGVVVRRILVPQGYQLSTLVNTPKDIQSKSKNPSQLFQSSIVVATPIKIHDEETDFMTAIRYLMEIKISQLKWKMLTYNPELAMHQVEQIIVENELLTVISVKGYSSLEDLIIERSRSQTYFNIKQVSHLVFQMSKFLTLLEFKRDFHLNLSATNLILPNKPEGDSLEFKLSDFGIRPLYLRMYFELMKRYQEEATPPMKRQASQSPRKFNILNEDVEEAKTPLNKGEMVLSTLFENDLLNKALVNELIKHKNSEDLEETLKSLLLFYDRISSVVTILRAIRLIVHDDFNKVIEGWLETPNQRSVIDLRFIQIKLTQLINANTSLFYKLLVGQVFPIKDQDQNEDFKSFQILIASLKILLGPPDYVIADQLNKDKKELDKRVSVKNIRVAYQTLMIFHENSDRFTFVVRSKDDNIEEKEKPRYSTMNFLQKAEDKRSQSKILQGHVESEYYLYFTNKFAGISTILDKSEFNDLKRMFLLEDNQNIIDIQDGNDLSHLLRQINQDQQPKPLKVLVARKPKQKKLIIFRMNNQTLLSIHQNKQQKQIILGIACEVYLELDLYNVEDAVLWLTHIKDTQKPLYVRYHNIHKIGESQSLKLSSSTLHLTSMIKLDMKFDDSMITERWVAESLGILFFGLPELKELGFSAQGNQFSSTTKKDHPDYEQKLNCDVLLLPYWQTIMDNFVSQSRSIQTKHSLLEKVTINLSDNGIHDIFIIILSQYLKCLTQVQSLQLNLSSNQFSDTAVQTLLECLPPLSLTSLQLKLNQIPTLTYFCIESVQKFIQGVVGTIKLLHIEINSIKFGLRGGEFLMKSFHPKQQVRTIQTSKQHEEEYEVEELVEQQVQVEVEDEVVEEVKSIEPTDGEDDDFVQLNLDDDYQDGPSFVRRRIDEIDIQVVEVDLREKEKEKEKQKQTRTQTIMVKRIIKRTRQVTTSIDEQITETISMKLESLILNLESCGLGDSGIIEISKSIQSLHNLSSLNFNLEKNQISDEGSTKLFMNLSQLGALESISLNFKTNRLGPKGMDKFGTMKCSEYLKFIYLNLYNNQLQDKGMAILGLQLSKLPGLLEVQLDVGLNQVQEGLYMLLGTILSTSTSMERIFLDMSQNLLDREPPVNKIDQPLRNLAKKCKVQTFTLRLQQVTGITEQYMQLTSSIIGSMLNLKQLTLNLNKVQGAENRSVKVLESLAYSLSDLLCVVDLNFSLQKTKINDFELDVLSIQIVHLHNLKKLYLNLQDNDIKKGLPTLAIKLSQLQNLVYLKVDVSKNTQMDADGCHQMIDNLSRSPALECLDLQIREINISDDQLIVMGRMLMKMDSLLVLNLDVSGNQIRERGATMFGQCMNQLKQLKALTVDLGLRKNNILYDVTPHYKDLVSRLVFYRFL